jgi:SAM-dependent methyltransferase
MSNDSIDDLDLYLSGKKLYGDDFSVDAVEDWYRDEQEAYRNLGAGNRDAYSYGYHALNALHGFTALGVRRFEHCLGFGSAYGDELLPLANRMARITIVDPSESFKVSELGGVPVTFVQAGESGDLPFEDYTFDLVTALGVLHHVPNVTHVINELFRCLEPGGVALLREPIVSMGNWTLPRLGLTKRERGIPDSIFLSIVVSAGFRVLRRRYCVYSLVQRLGRTLGIRPYASPVVSRVDWVLSSAFRWNQNYHPRKLWHKLQPTSVYLVLEKPR